jgi:hypothetical protein
MPEVIIVPFIFATLAFVIWTSVNAWQRRQHLRLITDLNSRLLDRMGSVKDFSEFLQTPGGSQFLDTLTADKGSTGPTERILRAVQTGIVISVVGVGFLFIARIFAGRVDPTEFVVEPIIIIGIVLLSLGIGFLLAAVASYVIGRRLGVLR